MKSDRECVSCGEFVDENEGYAVEFGEHEGEPICEECYHGDEYHTSVIAIHDGERVTYRVGSYKVDSYDDDLDEGSPEEEYIKSIHWVSTDPWRGYFEGKEPKGWVSVLDQWFCPQDGTNIRNDLALFHSRWEKEQNPPFPFLVAFLQTSNVFSCTIQAYIPAGCEDGWREWLDEEETE